jgi:hypothetical protein
LRADLFADTELVVDFFEVHVVIMKGEKHR